MHEQVVRLNVIGDLLTREPCLEPDVVFGIRAFGAMEERLADRLMKSWTAQRSSLLRPLD